MGVQVNGMDQLLRQLQQMSQNVDETKARALDEGAEILRSKIAAETNRSSRRDDHAADNVIVDVDGDLRIVGFHKDHFYMKFQELGTSKMKANPVVGRSFESEKNYAQEKMKSVIIEELGL